MDCQGGGKLGNDRFGYLQVTLNDLLQLFGFLERSGQPPGPAVYIHGRRFGVDTALPDLDAAIRAELGDIAPLPDGRWPARQRVADEPALPLGLTDMVPVRSDPTRVFWIDPIPRSRKPVGRLQALAGQPPGLVTADEAALTCKLGGARLCLQPEWVTACQGAAAEDDDGNGDLADDRIEGRPYPYGNRRREGACPGGLGTGQAGGCRTPEGVFDLTGNVAEWVADGSGGSEGATVGGSVLSNRTQLGCDYEVTGEAATTRSPQVGFRCCR